ncbi:MAG: homoserine kinase [Pseudonocardiales bacterium]
MARPSFRAAPVRVRVPATSANLGPGFDVFALALDLYDDVVLRIADQGLSVDVAGEGADDLPRNARHLVVKAVRAAFDALGGQPRGLEVVCANRIPQSRGLGSSAAAIVAGIVAARALVLGGEELLDDAAALALAATVEGHADNVAACLLGGLTLAWNEQGLARALRLDPVGLAPILFVPATRSSTARGRRVLPDAVPLADAAANAARAALLVPALTGRPDLLFAATQDRLHQGVRAVVMPRTGALLDKLRADGRPAVLSGSGPAVLVLHDGGADLSSYAGKTWQVLRLAVDGTGATVLPVHG